MKWLVLPILCVAVALTVAQQFIAFTARQGLRTAQDSARTQSQPTAIAAVKPDTLGFSTAWVYVFRERDSGYVVVQYAPSMFAAGQVDLGDTTDTPLPVYVRGEPLPSQWIDSDSAMAIIRQNPVYRDWMRNRTAGAEPQLVAIRLRGSPNLEPDNTPVWVYIVPDSTHQERLTCWCTSDGAGRGCTVQTSSVPAAAVSLVLAPNPATDVVALYSPTPIESIELYSVTGRAQPARYTPTGDGGVLDVGALPSGCYLVRIRTAATWHTQLLHVVR